MGCLDKSKLDWEQYVAEEGIREELTTFNKGKEGYVILHLLDKESIFLKVDSLYTYYFAKVITTF
jgi:Bucentaur or craniofacial development